MTIESPIYPEETDPILPTSFDRFSPDNELQPYKGKLVFDNPKELAKVVGIRPKVAKILKGVHLMDETEIESRITEGLPRPIQKFFEKYSSHDHQAAYTAYTNHAGNLTEEVLIKVRKYRVTSGNTLTLSQEELTEKFPLFSNEKRQSLLGIDLSNQGKVGALPLLPEESGSVLQFVKTYVAEDQKKTTPESWNLPLREAGKARESFLSEHGKGVGRTPKLRDWREVAALVARGASDFDSRVGLILAAVNTIAITGKEIKTYNRIKRELKKTNLHLRWL